MSDSSGHSLPLALTMGEPAGVGPELAARVWHERLENHVPTFLFVGPSEALTALPSAPPLQVVETPGEAMEIFARALPVLARGALNDLRPGEPDALNADAVIGSIEAAVELALGGQVAGVVTNPIQKSSLKAAGFAFAGHTDYLATLCGMAPEKAVMMLAAGDFRVVPLSHHVALKDAIGQITTADIVDCGKIVLRALSEQFGFASPRLAVAGLNPHAGEAGAFGDEEISLIEPAVAELKASGADVTGPYSPDTLFTPVKRQSYDAALCMYHDQALIPLKSLGIDNAVNITLGLPIVRTSPAHGTALSLAGKGTASPDSLRAALREAAALAAAGR
jgi:4-hydroxythreonine-4-phosphate dehydrogenase